MGKYASVSASDGRRRKSRRSMVGTKIHVIHGLFDLELSADTLEVIPNLNSME